MPLRTETNKNLEYFKMAINCLIYESEILLKDV